MTGIFYSGDKRYRSNILYQRYRNDKETTHLVVVLSNTARYRLLRALFFIAAISHDLRCILSQQHCLSRPHEGNQMALRKTISPVKRTRAATPSSAVPPPEIPAEDEFEQDTFQTNDHPSLGPPTEIQGLSPVAMRLLQAASDMKESPDSYERAFLARQLIQCTFPHKDPGNLPIWSRTNGNLTLSIRPLYDEDKKSHKYPYGTIPRLFLYWMVTEAARTKSRRLFLGRHTRSSCANSD